MKKRIVKTTIVLLFVLFTLFFTITSNVNADTTSIATDISSLKTLYSLSMDYRFDLSYEKVKDSDAAISLNVTNSKTFNFNENIVSNAFALTNISSNYIDIRVLKNSCSSDTFTINDGPGLMLPSGINNDGAEIAFSLSGNYALKSIALSTSGSAIANTNNVNYQSMNVYGNEGLSFNIEDNITELKIKNDMNSSKHFDSISLNVCKVNEIVSNASFQKNGNKNICLMQIIGRIDTTLYNKIITDSSTQGKEVYFGLVYGNVSALELPTINDLINCLKSCDTVEDPCVRLIDEIEIHNLKGYDEAGYNLVTNDIKYYQWGVKLNNVSKFDYNVKSFAYIRVKNGTNNYTVYKTANENYSVNNLINTYISMNAGNKYDQMFFNEFINKRVG